MLSCFLRVHLFATPWTIASQALLSMGFSRQEYWSGLLWLPTGDLPNSGIDFVSLNKYLHWQAGSLPLAPPGKPIMQTHVIIYLSKPTECTAPRINLNVNYQPWKIMMYQCKLIDCNNISLWLEMLIVEGAMCIERYMGILYFLLNFAENLKLF